LFGKNVFDCHSESITTLQKAVRVYIEPVDLELENDGSLLITSLQSALPGASGIYFKLDCKKSLKFDGKKLYPPNDGWQNRRYYIKNQTLKSKNDTEDLELLKGITLLTCCSAVENFSRLFNLILKDIFKQMLFFLICAVGTL
uniref:TDP43_N domain-containing protein n=1 Tax=Enterobius vermicularis TaxID=51028 RepID=A0A0N4VDC2_ENTVE